VNARLLALAALAAVFEAPRPAPPVDVDGLVASPWGSVAELDARAMAALDQRGLSLAHLLEARGKTNDALAETSLFGDVLATLSADLEELDRRAGLGPAPLPNRPFTLSWLRDPRAHFELTGVVNRFDRAFVDGGDSCGEARLVYRLVLEPHERPPTPLPMTINLVFPQRGSCAALARRWTDLPARGEARVAAIAALYRSLPAFVKLEVDLQNLHGPALRANQDDHAEYLLRTFERHGDHLAPAPLLDTPNEDLSAEDRFALIAWIRDHFAEIDAGVHVIPERFLAMRSISFAPRGAARRGNRPFSEMFADEPSSTFADLPYDSAKLVKSPRGLLRRLDQATCAGCHETRAIAGFHLLGEDRSADARFNALALGRSTHFASELPWRVDAVAHAARAERFATPRPFADREKAGPGGVGAHCALDADPTFAGWTCADGLRCRNLVHDDVGTCVPADANHEGDACEDARVRRSMGADGDWIDAAPKETCIFHGTDAGKDACSPNHFGFPGGMCSDACTELGRVRDGFVCADLPASGYETDCFPLRVPVEKCLETHSARRVVRGCDAAHPCRDDYACARVPGLPRDEGACVPPYFVFQARVDGPVLDR